MQTPVFDPAPRHNSVSTDDSDVVIGGVDDQPVPPQADNLADAAASGMAGVEDFFDVNPNSLGDLLDLGMLGFNGWHSSGPSPFDFRLPTPDNVLRIARDEEKWHVSNGAFVSCLDSVKKKVATNATLDLHVPFKAAIWGWDSVGPEANHPVWSAMRQVDQRVFGTWRSKAQRIALMYVCQTLVQVGLLVTDPGLLIMTYFAADNRKVSRNAYQGESGTSAWILPTEVRFAEPSTSTWRN